MNTEFFTNLMEIGRLFNLEFNEKNDDRVKEWTGTEDILHGRKYGQDTAVYQQ